MRIHTTPRRRAAALLAIALAFGACGGGDDGDSSAGGGAGGGETTTSGAAQAPEGGEAPGSWPADRCGIVPEADVSEAVGSDVTAEEFEPFGCAYSSGAVIDYYGSSVECEGIEARDDEAEPVDGLGAHAVYGSGNTDEVLAVTLDDGRCFMVHGQYTGDGEDDSRRAIARAVLAAS